jgi:lysylphosphatidylglycerol synthetase-like protein (DUF2156 family)
MLLISILTWLSSIQKIMMNRRELLLVSKKSPVLDSIVALAQWMESSSGFISHLSSVLAKRCAMLASFSVVENISLGSTAKLCAMLMAASWISLFFSPEVPPIALLLRGQRFIRDSRMGCLHQAYLYLVTTRTSTQFLWQRPMQEVPPLVQGMRTTFIILSFEFRLNAPSVS